MTMTPTETDRMACDANEGPLPSNADALQVGDRYRLWQAYAMVRLWKGGQLDATLAAQLDRRIPPLILDMAEIDRTLAGDAP